jgi:hypothetical protein
MKGALLLILFAAVWARAEQPDDRAVVCSTIHSLNEVLRRGDVFTDDSDARPVLEGLWKGKRPSYRIRRFPTVTISHEPWGEATIGFSMELENPRMRCGAVRFVSSSEAIAAATFVYREDGEQPHIRITPLQFVMKKIGDEWKIASVRVITP